jgi:hypothetical protein
MFLPKRPFVPQIAPQTALPKISAIAPWLAAELAAYLSNRRRVYDQAWDGDLRRAAKAHGDGPVQEALAMIEAQRNQPAEQWDRCGHAAEVRQAIIRLLSRKQEAPEGFDDGVKI